MNLLSIKDLEKRGRDATLFSGVTFGLEIGHKAALIGKNGTGKSTLLNCIAGNLQPDKGTIVTAKECRISFLPQNPMYSENDTIRSHIFKSRSGKLEVIRRYEELCLEINSMESSPRIQEEFDKISEEMTKRSLWDYDTQIKQILSKFGITNLDQTMGSLSGGMIKKVALAQVLIDDSQLLLLDEPTNHLDVQTISWLEEYLCNTQKAVLMVTHDRYFLDNVCASIYELSNGKVKFYIGNYSSYLEKKATETEIQENTERRIESVLRKEKEWLLRGPQARGTKAKARVDSIKKMISREKIAKDKGFDFQVLGRRLGGTILELTNVSKTFATPEGKKKIILKDFSYSFKKGERLGIFGLNGVGKTTLLNLLTGTINPDEGKIKKGENTVFGYYKQQIDKEMFFSKDNYVPTVLEYIQEKAEIISTNDGKQISSSRMLEYFGFIGRIQYSPINTLSGGEQKRLYLVKLLMQNPNFLILDEPTNDFDVFTLAILESFLETYTGCLIVVSHDRCFMDKTVDTMLVLKENGEISGFVGSCSEYLQLLDSQETETKKNTIVKQEKTIPKNKPTVKRRTFKEQKEFEALEEEIFTLEEKKPQLEALLSGTETDFSKIKEITDEYNQVLNKLEILYERWEFLGNLEEY